METHDKPPARAFPNSHLSSPPATPGSRSYVRPPPQTSYTSPIYKRMGLAFLNQSPPLEFIEPIGQGPHFHFTRPELSNHSSRPSSASSEFEDDNKSENESDNEIERPARRVEKAKFILEVLESDPEYDSETEVVRPDHYKETKSDKDRKGLEKSGFINKFSRLQPDRLLDEDKQLRIHRRKKKRWSAGILKRSHSQSLGSDSDDNYIPPQRTRTDKVEPASVTKDFIFADNLSVSSLADTTFSGQGISLSSQSSVEELMTAKDELVALLQADEELKPLYAMAVTKASIGAERFARNLHRLLKMYAKDLRAEAKERLHYMAARLTYSGAGYVVNAIRKQYDPEYKDRTKRVNSAISQRDREQQLNQYLSRLELCDRQQASSTNPNDDSDASVSDDAWDNNTAPIHTLQQVRIFMVSGRAMRNLRCGFRQFVEGSLDVVLPKQEDKGTSSGLVSPDDSSPINVSQKDKQKQKGQISIEEANSNGIGTVLKREDMTAARPVAASNSGSTSCTRLCGLETVSKTPKAEVLADSPTIPQPLESTLEIVPNERDSSRNKIRKILVKSVSRLTQPVVAFLGRQMDLKLIELFDSLVSRMGALFTRWLRQAETMLEVLGVRENKISLGSQRLRWTCSCGKSLYDDFVELQPWALEDLRRRLESKSTSRQYNNGNNTLSASGFFGLGGFLSRIGRASWSQGNNRIPPSAGRLPTHNPSHGSAVSPIHSSAPPNHLLYLLLCINSGNFGVDLHHERIQHIKCDRALFHFLRKTYGQCRSKLLYATSLRTVSRIKLVKFAADMSAKVDIHPHSMYCDKSSYACVPPESKVEPAPNSEYSCKPIPAPHIPPIGENYMMHLYSSPGCINQSQVWVYNQIPKRTRGQLMARPEAPAEGWGVHFEEGWHWPKIWAGILTLFLGGSLMFGVLYAVLRRDAQSAFRIASYWITAATILVGYLTTRNA